jgi:outer membrane protein
MGRTGKNAKNACSHCSTYAYTPSLALAENFSISVGPQRELFRGWVQYKGNKIDIKDDLHIEDKTKIHLSLEWKHKVKLLPDLKVDYLRVKTSGTGRISKNITFGDVTFNASDTVHTDLKSDQIDVTFFYNPVEREKLNIQAGAGFKYLTGYINLKSLTTGAYSNTDYDIPVPCLYASATAKISHLNFGAEVKGLTYYGSYFYDWKLKAGVKLGRAFASVGYRYERLRIDDIEDLSTDLKIEGIFGEIGVRF